MAKTNAEKITDIQEQIAQLENKQKKLVQEQKLQERNTRTKRLCQRMELIESLLPDTVPLTEEQLKGCVANMWRDVRHSSGSEGWKARCSAGR